MASKASAIQLDIAANLLRWRMFVAVAEEGSLTRAALHLDSDQTALSRQITALELQCGMRLFDRTGRGVKLSEAGERFLPQVKDLLAQAEQLELDIRGKAPMLSGTVTVALMASLAHHIVGPLFVFLRESHPGVRLRVLEGASSKVDEWLADGRADIGLRYRYSLPLPMFETALVISHACLVGAPGDRATASDTVDFKTLSSVPLVLPSAPNALRHALDLVARSARITLTPVMESDSLTVLKSLAMHQAVNVVLGLHVINEEVAAGKLQVSRIVEPPIQATISISHSKAKAPSRSVSLVYEMLCRLIADAERSGVL